MPNLKYKAAPDNYYCGDECYTYRDLPSGECSYGSGKQCPIGYTETANSRYCGDCSGAATARCCEKNINDPVWNPLTNAYLNDTTDVTNINKVYKCCMGETIGITAQQECGSLWQGKKDNEPTCNNILKGYCNSNPNELTKVGSTCYDYAMKYPEQLNLPKICSEGGRANLPEWSDICSCYQPFEFYEKLNKSMNEEWGVPLNYMNFQPECIYPKCKLSPFKRSQYSDLNQCPNPSFTKCISDIKMNLDGSKINKLQINQLPTCMNTFTKSSPPGGTYPGAPPGGTYPGAPPGGTYPGGDDALDKDNEKKKKMMIFAAFFMVMIIIIVMMKSSKNGRDKSRSYGGEFMDLNSY